jgi:hypothetical protein
MDIEKKIQDHGYVDVYYREKGFYFKGHEKLTHDQAKKIKGTLGFAHWMINYHIDEVKTELRKCLKRILK